MVKSLPANAGDMTHGFDPWVGKIPGRGHGNPLQYSCLEDSKDRGAWWAAVHRVTKGCTESNTTEATKPQQQPPISPSTLKRMSQNEELNFMVEEPIP